MRIALAQIQAAPILRPTSELVEDYTRRAADAGAQLGAVPRGDDVPVRGAAGRVAEPLDGPWADGVREHRGRRRRHRRRRDVRTRRLARAGRVTNTLIAAGPDVDAHYDKIHLYDAFGFTESRTVAPGHEPVVITVDGVGVGLTLCYDIRFPELYVELARRGAQLITVHASWGTGPGKLEQWTLLARARALDTGSFVAAVGQAYPGDEIAAIGPTGVGGSVVASPFGEVVASAGADPQLLVTDVDPDTVQPVRDTIAVLRNRSDFTEVHRAESRG